MEQSYFIQSTTHAYGYLGDLVVALKIKGSKIALFLFFHKRLIGTNKEKCQVATTAIIF